MASPGRIPSIFRQPVGTAIRPFPATAISQSGSAELAGEKDAKPTTTAKAIAQARQGARMSWRSRRLRTERGTLRISASDLPSLDTSVIMIRCTLHGFQLSARRIGLLVGPCKAD